MALIIDMAWEMIPEIRLSQQAAEEVCSIVCEQSTQSNSFSLFLSSLVVSLQLISADKNRSCATCVIVAEIIKGLNKQTLERSHWTNCLSWGCLFPYCIRGEMLTCFSLKTLTGTFSIRISKIQCPDILEANVRARHLSESYILLLQLVEKCEGNYYVAIIFPCLMSSAKS